MKTFISAELSAPGQPATSANAAHATMKFKKIGLSIVLIGSAFAATAAPMRITLDVVGMTEVIGTGPGGSAQPFTLHWSAQYDTENLVQNSSPYREYVQDGIAASIIETNLPVGIPSIFTDAPSFGHGNWQGPYLAIGGPAFGEPTDEGVTFQVRPQDGVLPTNILSTPGTLAFSSADGLSGDIYRWNEDGSGNGHMSLYPATIRITVSAIPEPATYGMLVVGFAWMGIGIKRQRH